MATVEDKYNMLRTKLTINGYDQLLSFESILLVERLVHDLLHFKNNCSSYKMLADELMQQCNELKMKQEPLEQGYDNLCRENNFLSLQVIQKQDSFQENVNGLKNQISELKNAHSDLELLNMQHITRIGELEEEVLLQRQKLLTFEGFAKYVKGTPQSSEWMKKMQNKSISSEDDVKSLKKINNYISYLCSPNLQDELSKEFDKLKLEKKKLSNMIELYKYKVRSRDIEIKRLHVKLKKVALPLTNNIVCKCHFIDEKIFVADDDDKEKALKESRIRCCSLMERTISLSHHIKFLEKKIEIEHSNSGKPLKKSLLYKSCICKQIQILQAIYKNCFCAMKHSKIDVSLPNSETEFKKSQENGIDSYKVNTDLGKLLNKLESEEPALFVENEKLKKNNMTLKNQVISLEMQLSHCVEEMSKLKLDRIEGNNRYGLLQMNIKSPQNKSNSLESGGDNEAALKINNAENQPIVDLDPKQHYDCLCMEKKNSKDVGEVFNQTYDICCGNIKSLQLVLEKVKAERDYYCKEYHCLQDKLCQSPLNKTEEENSKVDETQHCNKTVLEINSLLKANIDALTDRNSQLEEQNKCLKKINENLQEQLKYDDVMKSKQGYELSRVENKIKVLELDRNDLLSKLSSVQHILKKSEATVFLLEREKDQYRCKLDNKTVIICEFEKESQQKSLLINAYEDKILNFEAELARAYEVTDMYKKLTDRLKGEVEEYLRTSDTLTADNKHLLMDMAKITQENDILKTKINCSENEVASLKQRLQVYVEEVRRVEEVLESKENERENLLEQFRALSMEAMHLENSNQTLENEKKIATASLRIVNERLDNLQQPLNNTNSSTNEFQKKAAEINNELEYLRQLVSKFKSDNLVLQTSMEYFKTIYELKKRELSGSNKEKKQLLDGMQQIEQNHEGFETNINLAQNIVEVLKHDHKKYNHELVKSMAENTVNKRFSESSKKCIDELEHRLHDMNETVQKCNIIFSSLKNENLSLDHDGVNKMFERISGDESNSFSTSL